MQINVVSYKSLFKILLFIKAIDCTSELIEKNLHFWARYGS